MRLSLNGLSESEITPSRLGIANEEISPIESRIKPYDHFQGLGDEYKS